ncbi:MAG: alpha/beta hydrolase [Pseudomonadota bacterium]
MSKSLFPTRRGLMLGGAVALASGLAAYARRGRERAARIEADNPPRGAFVDAAGLRVHYVEMGPRDAPPLVLLHGATGNLNDMTFDLAPRLADRYRVICFDRPGLGHTERPAKDGHRPAVQAAILRAAADRLGVVQPLVLGHSWGAAAALAWGLDAPEPPRGLVIVSAAAMPWGEGGPGLLSPLFTSRLAAHVGVEVLRLTAGGDEGASAAARIFRPQPVPEGYMRHLQAELILRPASLQANTEDIQRLEPELTAMAARYPDLRSPLAILHGEPDTITAASIHSEGLHALAPDSTYEALPQVGHMLHHAAPETVAAAIDGLVSRT